MCNNFIFPSPQKKWNIIKVINLQYYRILSYKCTEIKMTRHLVTKSKVFNIFFIYSV